MSIDKFFNQTYSAKNYNCAHFVCDVWSHLHNSTKMGDILRGFLCAKKDRKTIKTDLSKIVILEKPVSPCIVLMQRPKAPTHVGLFYKGRILHLTKSSVQYQPLDVVTLGFNKIRFLTC